MCVRGVEGVCGCVGGGGGMSVCMCRMWYDDSSCLLNKVAQRIEKYYFPTALFNHSRYKFIGLGIFHTFTLG